MADQAVALVDEDARELFEWSVEQLGAEALNDIAWEVRKGGPLNEVITRILERWPEEKQAQAENLVNCFGPSEKRAALFFLRGGR